MQVWRKMISESDCQAIAAELRELLAATDRDGRRLWTQASIGERCGLAQQFIQRALKPEGVGPSVRDAILQLTGLTMDELKVKHAKFVTLPKVSSPPRYGYLPSPSDSAAGAGTQVRATVLPALKSLQSDGFEEEASRRALMLAIEHEGWETSIDLYRLARHFLDSIEKSKETTNQVSGVLNKGKAPPPRLAVRRR